MWAGLALLSAPGWKVFWGELMEDGLSGKTAPLQVVSSLSRLVQDVAQGDGGGAREGRSVLHLRHIISSATFSRPVSHKAARVQGGGKQTPSPDGWQNHTAACLKKGTYSLQSVYHRVQSHKAMKGGGVPQCPGPCPRPFSRPLSAISWPSFSVFLQ